MSTKEDLFIKMTLASWQGNQQAINKIIGSLSEEEMNHPIIPGKNTPAWIVGHLAVVNDGMFPILGLGEKMKPEYEKALLHPVGTVSTPPLPDILQFWNDTNARINEKMAALSPGEWFSRHTQVSEEDFAKEPHRNKLNVLLNRSNHMSHHRGQLALLAKKQSR
jgi:uncharacterized damage-inducible protein DinB